MQLDSVQIGSPVATDDSSVGFTGIYKEPVGTAEIHLLGLTGDSVLDIEHHGGADQAVYLYCRDDYTAWERELGRSLPDGAFGENLTLSGISSQQVHVGDRFEIGAAVVLEATSCRIPCRTFAAKMGENNWIARFREARRPGFYARVISGGEVAAGDTITHLPLPDTVPVLETQDLYYDTSASTERIRRALESPIAARTRAMLERRVRSAAESHDE